MVHDYLYRALRSSHHRISSWLQLLFCSFGMVLGFLQMILRILMPAFVLCRFCLLSVMVGFVLVVDLIILLEIVPMLGKHLLVIFCIFVSPIQSCSSQLSSMMCSFILVTVFRISMALLMIFMVLLLMAILVVIMLLVIIMLLVLLLSLSSMFGSHFLM